MDIKTLEYMETRVKASKQLFNDMEKIKTMTEKLIECETSMDSSGIALRIVSKNPTYTLCDQYHGDNSSHLVFTKDEQKRILRAVGDVLGEIYEAREDEFAKL